jgi:hypothetical protein
LFEKSEGEYVVVELPKAAPAAIREMFAAFDVALNDAYAQGRSDGANALERMISGDLKVEDINAMHIERE